MEAEGAALVGEIVDVHDADGLVTVRFAAHVDGYRGWQWSVTVAVIDPQHPTVSEVVLLPGPEALIAPAWVPWQERIRGGDLAPGDLLPAAPDDARIVPAYVQSDDPAVEELAFEVGLGRVRVLSRFGRAEAADRWHDGSFGPGDEMARLAPGHCASCAFYLPLAGAMGAGFGVCANEFSPADGRVVDLGYGCGAHSEARITPRSRAAISDAVVDELLLEVHVRDVEAIGGADDDEDLADGAVDVGLVGDGGSAGDEFPDAGLFDAAGLGAEESGEAGGLAAPPDGNAEANGADR